MEIITDTTTGNKLAQTTFGDGSVLSTILESANAADRGRTVLFAADGTDKPMPECFTETAHESLALVTGA